MESDVRDGFTGPYYSQHRDPGPRIELPAKQNLHLPIALRLENLPGLVQPWHCVVKVSKADCFDDVLVRVYSKTGPKFYEISLSVISLNVPFRH